MKKNIIAMAVAAAVAAPAAAMADTTLYGKIHSSYDLMGGDTADNQDYSLSSNSSRLGVKGKEDISDNLSLIYQWETTLDFGDTGDGVGYGPRNTFVGFTGDSWGTLIAGRHDTPMKGVSRKYDLFGDTVGDSRAILRGKAFGNDWDMRTDNTVAYATPDLGGFSAMAAYVSDWEKDADGDYTGNNEFDAWSVSAGYEIAGFSIDGAWEQHNTDTSDQEAYRVGAGYKIGGFKVVGLYQNADIGFDGNDYDAWGLGAAYSFGKSTVKAQYYMADDLSGAGNEDTGAELWAVGYDYKLSKQTSVYAAYGSMDADSSGNYVLAKGTGHGEQPVLEADGTDSNAFSVGLVHKF
ncbi:porin [Guyparkeria sp. TX1]|uniref:porin n=1 Tax=Guyparkeria sp. TX1 TaxID=3115001 RepID=UPI0039776909